MEIERKYELWRVCSAHGVPAMKHIMIERIGRREGIAVALDRCMLAVAPVTLEESDLAGPIHKDAFQHAFRTKPKRKQTVTVLLEPDIVRYPADGSAAPRLGPGAENVTFPDWRSIVLAAMGRKKEAPALVEQIPLEYLREPIVKHFAFDPNRMVNLHKALGSPQGLKFSFYLGHQDAISVRPLDAEDREYPCGLLMPMLIPR